MKTLQVKSVLCGFSVLAVTLAPSAQAAHKHAGMKQRATQQPIAIEAWPGQRVILVLPLAVGANWNADPALGSALLSDGEANLEHELRQTRKLSVLRLKRNNPVFQRAIQDKVITDVELADWTAPDSTTPLLERSRQALLKLQPSFEQEPMIGDFAIEELRTSGDLEHTAVQVQVSARLYGLHDLSDPTPKTIVVTSIPEQSGRDTLKAIHLAVNNAFVQVAAQLTAPIEIADLTHGGGMGMTMPVAKGNAAPVAPGTAVTAPAQPVTPLAPTLPDTTAPATPAGTAAPAPVIVPAPPESPAPVTPGVPAPVVPVEPVPAAPATPAAPAPVTPAPAAPAQ